MWRTANNGQPLQAENNNKFIGEFPMSNKNATNGQQLANICETCDFVCFNAFIPKTKTKESYLIAPGTSGIRASKLTSPLYKTDIEIG